MEQLIFFSKKYGVTGLLVVWLWWTNERLTIVENELHKCYENSYRKGNSQQPIKENQKNIAILRKNDYEDFEKTDKGNT